MQECDFPGYKPDEALYNAEPEVSLDVFYSDVLRTVGSPIGPRSTHSPAVAKANFLTVADAYKLMHEALQVSSHVVPVLPLVPNRLAELVLDCSLCSLLHIPIGRRF